MRRSAFLLPYCGIALAATLAVGTLQLRGQESPPPSAAAARFQKVNTDWEQINGQLGELSRQIRSATGDERDKLIADYEQLIERATAMIPQLRDAAVAAYKEAPNQDPAVTRTVVGMASAYVQQDKYKEARALTDLLLRSEAKEKGVHNFAGEAAYCLDDFATAEKHLNLAREEQAMTQAGNQYLADIETAKAAWLEEEKIRAAEARADDLPRVKLETSQGTMVLELYENEAPQTVGNFVSLVEKGFYNGLTFHRVLSNFMAQGGCPDGTGGGGPGYEIYCECQQPNHRKHFRGTLSMAHAGKDTGGSQFFLTFKRTAHLDGRHTVFGRVIEGLDVLAKLQRRNPQNPNAPAPDKIVKADVIRKRNHTYEPKRVE